MTKGKRRITADAALERRALPFVFTGSILLFMDTALIDTMVASQIWNYHEVYYVGWWEVLLFLATILNAMTIVLLALRFERGDNRLLNSRGPEQ